MPRGQPRQPFQTIAQLFGTSFSQSVPVRRNRYQRCYVACQAFLFGGARLFGAPRVRFAQNPGSQQSDVCIIYPEQCAWGGSPRRQQKYCDRLCSTRSSLNPPILWSTLAMLWKKKSANPAPGAALWRERCFNPKFRVVLLPRFRQCGSSTRLPGIVVWDSRCAPVWRLPSTSSQPARTQHSAVCDLDREQCACDGPSLEWQTVPTGRVA